MTSMLFSYFEKCWSFLSWGIIFVDWKYEYWTLVINTPQHPNQSMLWLLQLGYWTECQKEHSLHLLSIILENHCYSLGLGPAPDCRDKAEEASSANPCLVYTDALGVVGFLDTSENDCRKHACSGCSQTASPPRMCSTSRGFRNILQLSE